MRKAIEVIITGYQKLISPLFGSTCRFYPSCSQYVKETVMKKGVLIGVAAGIARLCKCHPLHPGGYDPVKL